MALVIANRSEALLNLDAARSALTQVTDVQSAKLIRDRAEAVRVYLIAAGLDRRLQHDAAEIKLRAERRAGELLAQLPLRGGDRRSPRAKTPPSLPVLGVTRHCSARWQRLASVPEELFEAYCREARNKNHLVSNSRMVQYVHQHATDAGPADEFTNVFKLLRTRVQRGEQYGCVLIRPPWQVAQRKRNKQPSIEWFLNRLAQLPIRSLISRQAHVHLCVPPPYLYRTAQVVLGAWGVRYTSNLVVIKPHGDYTAYWKLTHEHLVLATRGQHCFRTNEITSILGVPYDPDKAVDEIRSVLERVSPGPYLDIFAAIPRSDWTTIP